METSSSASSSGLSDFGSAIAVRSPDAVPAIKTLLNTALEGPEDAALKLEARLQMSVMGGPNQMEAVAANLEKRPPGFRPRRQG